MDKNTLSQYGWVVIVLIILAIMIGLASPFGNYISASVDNTTKGFGDKVAESLKIGGYSDAITEMKPLAFTLAQPFLSQATEAQTPNYIYAKQLMAKTLDDAIEMKEGFTYEGEPRDGNYYGTGSIIRVYKDGKLFGTYYLVVLGDINGDSVADGIDAAQINIVKFLEEGLTGAELAAVDLNRNGVLDEGSNGTTKEDYEATIELVFRKQDGYLKYYNQIKGGSPNVMYSKAVNKFNSLKDITKIVFEATQPEGLNFVSSGSALSNDNDAYDFSACSDNSVAAYLTLDGADKILHIAGKNDVIVAPTSLAGMFASLSKVKSIDFNNCFDTKYASDFSEMFSGCYALEEVKGVSNWDTSNATTMYGMFNACSVLKSVNGLNKWNTSNVTTFAEMFSGCCAIENIDVSNFDTSSATSLSAMFCCCDALEAIDVSNFDTSKVTEFDYMFAYSYTLKELDISNFDTRNATIMDGMFESCTGLQHIYVGENWDDHGTTGDAMFYDCGVSAVERK